MERASQQQPKPLSTEALAKREARAARRREQAAAVQQAAQQDDFWENTYDFSSFSIRVQEEFGGESCVGGTQWPGGVRVARYLDNPAVFPPDSLRGKTLIDLGSGCGLVAAVAAKHGARVLAVDKQIVMQILMDNLRTNGVLVEQKEAAALRAQAKMAQAAAGAAATGAAVAGAIGAGAGVGAGSDSSCFLPAGRVVAEELLWGPGVSHPVAPFDICIAAACLYMPKTVPLLLETLHTLSNDKSLIILAAIIGQNTLEHFLEICGQWFDYTAHRDEDGGVVGSSWEGNLSKLDVATRILVLKRKNRRQGNGGIMFSSSS